MGRKVIKQNSSSHSQATHNVTTPDLQKIRSGILQSRIPARYDICRRFRSYLRTTLIYLHTTSSYYQMSHLSEIFRFFCHRTQCGCLPLVLEARLPTVIATLVTFRSRLSSFTRSTCTANRSRDILLACHVFTEELIAI